MDEAIQMLKQIQDLSGTLIKAFSQAKGGGGEGEAPPAEEGGRPPGGAQPGAEGPPQNFRRG